MDLNYLLHRQQVERSRADSGSCDEARKAHAQLAALYEEAIGQVTRGRITFLSTREQRARNWSNELRRLVRVYDGRMNVLSC